MLLDYLIVNPNNRILSPFSGIEPPLWAGLIANWYRNDYEYQRKFWGTRNGEVKILDAEAEDLTLDETIDKIRSLSPKHILLVVMGNNPSASSTPKMVISEKIYSLISKEIPTTFTGLHPQAVNRANTFHFDLTKDMPSMAWDLLPMNRYRAHNWHCLDGSPRSPYASIYTSLGCPFSCSFCNIHALYGGQHKVWYRNPKEVIREIDILVKEYEVRNIKFWDELFTLNERHVESICSKIIKRGYDLNIWAYARVDSPCINYETLEMMREAGINWLAYGFESSSDTVLSASNKKANKEQAIRATNLTHDAGINIIGNFIFGLPNDTEETMQETLDFAKSLELEYVNFYTAKAYPGSALYDKDKDSKDWSQYDQYSGKDNGFSDRAFREFMSDKKYLNRIGNRFGQQAVEHINKLLARGKPVSRGSYE